MKEWMQRICLCFTPSRIALAESTRLFHGSVRFLVFSFRARDGMTFTLRDLTDFYIVSVTAHHIKINDLLC